MKLDAAIRRSLLNLATSNNTTRVANWSKTGNVVQWSAFLADENGNVFNGWFNATAAGSFTIEWSAIPTKRYQVRFRDQMTGSWSNLTGEIVTATTLTNAEDNSAFGQPSRFYQVILLP